MHPIVEAHKKAGNRVITIMGARNKDLLIMEDEMRSLSDELIICTDDGSYGRKDLVTVPLKELCESETPPRGSGGHRSSYHDEILRRDDPPL